MLLIASLETGLPRRTLDSYPSNPGPSDPGAIVILSGDGSYGAEAGIEQASGIGVITLDRMRAGALLHRKTGLPILVSGGVLETGTIPIAAEMADSLAREFGTPVRWIEAESIDTWENARFSAEQLRRVGVREIYLVTDAWHMRRALMAFRKAGVAAVPAPVRIDRGPRLRFAEFVPSPSALHNSYYAIHEWIGCAYYALAM